MVNFVCTSTQLIVTYRLKDNKQHPIPWLLGHHFYGMLKIIFNVFGTVCLLFCKHTCSMVLFVVKYLNSQCYWLLNLIILIKYTFGTDTSIEAKLEREQNLLKKNKQNLFVNYNIETDQKSKASNLINI